MIKLQNKTNNDKIYINPQHIVEVRAYISEEPRKDGGVNIYPVYRVFLVHTSSEISGKEFDTVPLQDWLNAATSHFSSNGKMLY